MSTTAVMGVDWKELTARTTEHLESVVDLPFSALLLIARELRTKVAEAADANVNPAYEARQSLSRMDLVSTIEHVAGHIDLSALESAVVDGVCEPFETGMPPSVDDSYYEGVATQPWHVAAGLVVPRPQIMAEVVLGLQERSAVVLTGPSGVGKSAILWMVPAALPGVLWYRIHRVSESDVPALIRLARAYSVSADTPVGFLVDAAGRGDFRGWARLRTDAAAVPGLLLAGAARIEDVAELGD
ncbi:MAG TPA: hypothetical protein ENH33_06510, partial [Actinobacteria bacterium]|nr:hypothetical protein [Actinomycetota bacterium]